MLVFDRYGLLALECHYILDMVSVREHVYRTYGCDHIVLAEDLEVASL
jgi:hypothetical protein